LGIMLALDGRELCIAEIAEETGMPSMKVSQSLIRMRLNGILESGRDGLIVFYKIHSPAAQQAVELVKGHFPRS
jgi:DNA-binding transcriptional ArsR family regulator